VSYFYGEAKMQAKGRGFLGFHKLKTVDEQTQVTTVTTYRQDYPFSGSPLATVVYKTAAPDAPILSSAVNTWDVAVITGTDSTKAYVLKLKKSEEQSFDYTDGSLLQAVITDNIYNNYGNLTDSTVVTTGKKVDGSGTSLTKVIDNYYPPDATYERLGRLISTTVTTTRDGQTEPARKSVFSYYTSGDANGALHLLKTEKVEVSGLPTTTTTYQYDGFGNKSKVITEASATDKRSVTYDYGQTGRYLLSTRNDLNQITTIDQRDEFGNIKAATDINSIQSRAFYDAMGGEYMRKDATGAWSRTDTQYCSPNVPCSDGARYRVTNSVAGGGRAYEYYDMLGRVIRSTKVGFDGSQIRVDTEYDNLSRTKRQSVPFIGTAAQYWTENTYDHLGRVIEATAPDGSKSSSTYAGNTTVVKNALNQTRTEYRNGLGQLAKMKDHLNGTIDYDYDLNGNLTKAKTTADGTSVSVRICYDSLGRKVAMHDPDKGGFKGNSGATCSDVATSNPKKAGWWHYSYNTYGELVEQTDSKGQKTKNYYDKMGRMVGRIDYQASGAIEGFSQWFYEGGVGTHNPAVKGKLTAVVMNTASGLTTAQAESFITSKTASCTENSSSCHKTLHDFDIYTRPVTTTVYYPGSSQAYVARTAYDFFGRAYKQYDALDGVITDANGNKFESGVHTLFNTNGYAYHTVDIATGKTLQRILKTNELGQVTREIRGNGLTSVNTYDIKTGLLTNQQTLNALNLSNVQNNVYGWDTVGNLKYRQNLSGKPGTPTAGNSAMNSYAQSESFCYDGLNRLIKTNAATTSTSACGSTTPATQDLRYDGHGNIKYKKGVGDYVYAASTVAGPHAVTTAGGVSYAYDANGNNISGDGRTLEYTSYDMVKKITKGSNATEFQYGPDRARWQRKDVKNGTPTTTTYIGNVERIQTPANTIEWKRNVAGVIFTYRTDTANKLQASDKRYLYTDHLGSVDLMTDANGEVEGQFSKVSHAMSFDAWGARRNIAQWDAATFNLALSSITVSGFLEPITRRGFTGHEMLDDMGIIHMNGRIYDAKLGRFLQADPFIQAAANTQSYNRYSYLLNNPLNATDPSGFFFSGLKKLWNKIRPFVGVIVAVVMCVYAACAGSAEALAWGVTAGMVSGGVQAAANGGNIVQGMVLMRAVLFAGEVAADERLDVGDG
jgi:RHS repeat-associated protein